MNKSKGEERGGKGGRGREGKEGRRGEEGKQQGKKSRKWWGAGRGDKAPKKSGGADEAMCGGDKKGRRGTETKQGGAVGWGGEEEKGREGKWGRWGHFECVRGMG